jgi:hypothetical protein
VAAARTLMLLGGIDQVKIDGKSANDIDRGLQIALLNDLCDLLIQRRQFLSGSGRITGGQSGELTGALAQTAAIQAQTFDGCKNAWPPMLQDSIPQHFSQRANILA